MLFNGGVFSIQNGGQGPVGMRYTRRTLRTRIRCGKPFRNANFRLAGKTQIIRGSVYSMSW